jgi:AraC-like DNA-binding protein/Tfp pilus assembly protein PilF
VKYCLILLAGISISAYSQIPGPSSPTLSLLIESSRKNQWVNSYLSLDYADKALIQAQKESDNNGIAKAQNLKGFCFWTFGDNELGIQSALDALAIAQNENDGLLQAESHYILARCYMDLRENSKAHESILKAEALALDKGAWELLTSIYNLKGVILFIDNRIDSALYYYNKAYEMGKTHAVDPINFPRIIANIGECYSEENPAFAFTYFNTALALAKETGNKIAEASITGIIGQAYLSAKDLKKAESHLRGALKQARSLGLRRVIRQAYGGLVEIELQQGRGNEAVIFLRQFYAVRDSLLNTSKIRQVVELEAKHELQIKEQNIKLLESEKRIQAIWTNLLIGLIVALIFLSAAVYKIQRDRYRKNRKMLDLEIDYLTQQHRETVDRYKALVAPGEDAAMESYDQALLKRAISIVELNIADPEMSVEKMATEMNMSRTSLHRKIKSITGFPPSELIRSIRLRTAAKLIANRVDTATQIALRVGFEDYSHFSKAFKRHFGVSPSSYEQQSNALGHENRPIAIH